MKPARWTVCPEGAVLTPSLRAFAESRGLDPDEAWASFQDHEFRPPGHTSVERTFRNYCRRCAEWGQCLAKPKPRPPLGQGPAIVDPEAYRRMRFGPNLERSWDEQQAWLAEQKRREMV